MYHCKKRVYGLRLQAAARGNEDSFLVGISGLRICSSHKRLRNEEEIESNVSFLENL